MTALLQITLPPDCFDRDPAFRRAVNEAHQSIQQPNLVHINGTGTPAEVKDRIMSQIHRLSEL